MEEEKHTTQSIIISCMLALENKSPHVVSVWYLQSGMGVELIEEIHEQVYL